MIKDIADKSETEIIESLKQSARDSWPGTDGESREKIIEEFLNKMLDNYSQFLGMSRRDILVALEIKRDYSANNFYQERNLPELKDIDIYDTVEDFKKKFTSHRFVCPACNGISTNPSVCDSGKPMDKKGKKICDWKAYGLLGTLNKGYRFVIKSEFLNKPVVYDIFNPVELTERK